MAANEAVPENRVFIKRISMNEGFRYQVCTHAKLSRWIVAAKRQKILMYIKGVKIKQRFRDFTNIYLCILCHIGLISTSTLLQSLVAT